MLMEKHAEQRKHKRLPRRTDVFVTGEAFSRFKTQSMDFSDGGLFVEGKVLSLLKVDTCIQIQVAANFEDLPVQRARVAWTNRYGAGIEYLLDS